MKKLLIGLLCVSFLLISTQHAHAVYDPLAIPNNKIGIHILFPSELPDAAKLINASGGDWGYVTIPIQAGDKDLDKWQAFMTQAHDLHVIPIIRLATEGDYFNTSVWRKPNYADVLDFANFLNSLTWPTKNRYVIIFNEVNRGDEWGGTPNPSEYANILSYAVTAFKSKNQDFFIISAGMDNAAANTGIAMNEYTFLTQMDQSVSGIFNQIDGLGSHAYPNPGFSVPPSVITSESIASFQYEKSLVQHLGSKNLPVFITETGWSRATIPDNTIALYFTTALSGTWQDTSVVAITPFLLKAGAGPFDKFSFTNADGSENAIYSAIKKLTKIKGLPHLVPVVLAASSKEGSLPVEKFDDTKEKIVPIVVSEGVKSVAKWFLGL